MFLFSLYLIGLGQLRYNDLFFKGTLAETAAKETLKLQHFDWIKTNNINSHNKMNKIYVR